MENLGNQGENLPVVEGALGALGASVANSTTPPTRLNTAPLQESGGASSSSSNSLTMTEFAKFMESFKSSMENTMKVLVSEEVDKKLASFLQTLLPHQHFAPTPL